MGATTLFHRVKMRFWGLNGPPPFYRHIATKREGGSTPFTGFLKASKIVFFFTK